MGRINSVIVSAGRPFPFCRHFRFAKNSIDFETFPLYYHLFNYLRIIERFSAHKKQSKRTFNFWSSRQREDQSFGIWDAPNSFCCKEKKETETQTMNGACSSGPLPSLHVSSRRKASKNEKAVSAHVSWRHWNSCFDSNTGMMNDHVALFELVMRVKFTSEKMCKEKTFWSLNR